MSSTGGEEPQHVQYPPDGMFKNLGAAQPIAPHWVIKDLLPVGLTIMGGPAKIAYKSTWLTGMMLLVTGHKHGGFPPELSVVEMDGIAQLHSAEALAEEIKPDAEEAYGVTIRDDWSILVSDDAGDWQLDDDDGIPRLLSWLNNNQPAIWALDPLRNFHTQDENDSRMMSAMLRPLRDWCKAHNSAGVIVHHTAKLPAKETEYTHASLRGSSAIFGLADGALIITPKKLPLFQIEAHFKRGASWKRDVKLNVRLKEQPKERKR